MHASAPVVRSMAVHSARSDSNPSQPAAVPFQPITWQRACESNSAAARISRLSNCARASADSAISVTRKRPKCALTSLRSASMAAVTGSRMVFDEGVSIPSSLRSGILSFGA